MKILLENIHAKVIEASHHEHLWLHGFLVFDGASNRNGQSERTHLYDVVHRKFPAGLLPLVRRGARQDGHKLLVRDGRTCPASYDADANLAWLEHRKLLDGRAYQIEAVKALVKATRGVLKAATASGKAEVAIGLAKAVPCKWLFLVHRQNLKSDVTGRWEKRGDGSPTWDLMDKGDLAPRLTTCTFQTLHRHLESEDVREKLKGVQGVIADECHVVAASTFLECTQALPNAFYRIGLSGTPLDRSDRKSILALAALGPIVYSVKSIDLINAGYAAAPVVRLVEHKTKGLTPGETWHQCYRNCIIESELRNDLIISIAKRARKPSILSIESIDHGKYLTKQLNRSGINSVFAWGSWSLKRRQEACKALAHGEVDVLVANSIFKEGLDVPEIRSVINGAGGASTISTIQRAGRGMRIEFDSEGKILEDSRTFELWDIADRGHRWLQNHAQKREHDYRREQWNVEIVSRDDFT